MTTTTTEGRCRACGAELRPGAGFCPACGAPADAAKPAPAVEDTKKSGGKSRWVMGIAAVALAFVAYLFVDHLPGGDHPVIARQPRLEIAPLGPDGHAAQARVEPRIEGDRISIPVSAVLDRRIVEFDFSDGSVTVPLIAFVTAEGRLVTAFRMCEPCNSRKFSIDGDRLSCGNCETQWSLNTLEGLQGSCQKYPPDPFPSRIEEDRVVMDLVAVRGWKIRL